MEFYSSIHHYYDYIFPLNMKQIDFTTNEFEKGASLLDIGCATGKLAFNLAKASFKINAFDLDSAMINRAKTDYKLPNLSYSVGNMLDIEKDFGYKEFDGVLCFGNTLVHLTDLELIKSFFKAVNNSLKENGKFIFQILNYQNILNNKIQILPAIDNDTVSFKRTYDFLLSGLINFKTDLLIKENGQIISNEIELLPITRTEIEKLLLTYGFKNIEFFGSFAKTKLMEDSLPLVVIAQK